MRIRLQSTDVTVEIPQVRDWPLLAMRYLHTLHPDYYTVSSSWQFGRSPSSHRTSALPDRCLQCHGRELLSRNAVTWIVLADLAVKPRQITLVHKGSYFICAAASAPARSRVHAGTATGRYRLHSNHAMGGFPNPIAIPSPIYAAQTRRRFGQDCSASASLARCTSSRCRWLPSASKFSGASHARRAAPTSGHSPSTIDSHALSRL